MKNTPSSTSKRAPRGRQDGAAMITEVTRFAAEGDIDAAVELARTIRDVDHRDWALENIFDEMLKAGRRDDALELYERIGDEISNNAGRRTITGANILLDAHSIKKAS